LGLASFKPFHVLNGTAVQFAHDDDFSRAKTGLMDIFLSAKNHDQDRFLTNCLGVGRHLCSACHGQETSAYYAKVKAGKQFAETATSNKN